MQVVGYQRQRKDCVIWYSFVVSLSLQVTKVIKHTIAEYHDDSNKSILEKSHAQLEPVFSHIFFLLLLGPYE